MTNKENEPEILSRIKYLADEIHYGTYPIQNIVFELCQLVVRWTDEFNKSEELTEYLKNRYNAAKAVLETLEQSKWHTEKRDYPAALHSAFTAGHIFSEFGLLCVIHDMEPSAAAGDRATKQRKEAGFKSGKERASERQPEWAKWQALADELYSKNNHLRKNAICKKVADHFGVSPKAVSNRVSNVGKPRKK